MSPEEIARYQSKAATVAAAWQVILREAPTRHALILAMAVADFETRLGDATGMWRGEHNWGAIKKRAITSDESAILLGHGVYPSGDDALRTARGLLTAGENEALHIDSNHAGPYFAWFWAFPNDIQGAAKFLDVLIGRRAAVRAIIDRASPTELAAAMYVSHYYEGRSKDAAENIRAYAARIEERATRIESALAGWPPSTPADPPPSPQPPPSPPERERGGAGWWIAGFALFGVATIFMGKRS